MSQVRKMSITGYKSIKKLVDFELRDLNVLIGANGAGKSNFISIFKMLNEMYEGQLQVYVQKQGGPDALLHFGRSVTDRFHAEFYFGNNGYKFDLLPTNDNRFVFETEVSWFKGVHYPGHSFATLGTGHIESSLKAASDGYSPYVRNAVSNWRVYHFHDTSDNAKVKQKHAVNDNLRLKPDAANLAAYLRMLRVNHFPDYIRIVDTIKMVAPFFGDFVYREVGVDSGRSARYSIQGPYALRRHIAFYLSSHLTTSANSFIATNHFD
jgi:predicted ATPase